MNRRTVRSFCFCICDAAFDPLYDGDDTASLLLTMTKSHRRLIGLFGDGAAWILA